MRRHRVLIARGADLKARSNAGFTALLFAAREGRIPAVNALLEAGADLNESLPVRRRGPQAARRRRRANGQSTAAPAEVGLNAFLLAAANAHYELAACSSIVAPIQTPRRRVYGAASGLLGAQGRHRRQQQPRPARLRQHGQPNVRARWWPRARRSTRASPSARAWGVTTLNSIGATPFLLAARTADAPLMKLLAELPTRCSRMTMAQRR